MTENLTIWLILTFDFSKKWTHYLGMTMPKVISLIYTINFEWKNIEYMPDPNDALALLTLEKNVSIKYQIFLGLY